MKINLFIIICILLFSCKEDKSIGSIQPQDIINEIKALESDADKISFLESILENDQAIRNGQKHNEIIKQYGLGSKEEHAYKLNMIQQDQINLLKIENYIKVFGYPDKDFGEKAITAPWLVIHHASGYNTREKNFDYIYQAYKDGIIDENSFSFLLGRMYQTKFGERLKMQNPYTLKDEINIIIKKLNLDE